MEKYILPILAGVAALLFLRRAPGSATAAIAAGDTPDARGLGNYPASTPDSVPTGITGVMASAFKSPTAAATLAAPPPQNAGSTYTAAPPVIQPMPVPAFMGGASWAPNPIVATVATGQFAPTIAPTPGPISETRSGRGHF